jgi:hypothetical protein
VRIELAEAQERAQIGEAVFSRSLAADNAEHQVLACNRKCLSGCARPTSTQPQSCMRGARIVTAKASCLPSFVMAFPTSDTVLYVINPGDAAAAGSRADAARHRSRGGQAGSSACAGAAGPPEAGVAAAPARRASRVMPSGVAMSQSEVVRGLAVRTGRGTNSLATPHTAPMIMSCHVAVQVAEKQADLERAEARLAAERATAHAEQANAATLRQRLDGAVRAIALLEARAASAQQGAAKDAEALQVWRWQRCDYLNLPFLSSGQLVRRLKLLAPTQE